MADITDLSGMPAGAGVDSGIHMQDLDGAILSLATLTMVGVITAGVTVGTHHFTVILGTIHISEEMAIILISCIDTQIIGTITHFIEIIKELHILIQDVQTAFTAAGQTPEVLQHDLHVDLM